MLCSLFHLDHLELFGIKQVCVSSVFVLCVCVRVLCMCMCALCVAVLEIIGWPFIESRNTPLEMYSKFVLAYQFWSGKCLMADYYFKLCCNVCVCLCVYVCMCDSIS